MICHCSQCVRSSIRAALALCLITPFGPAPRAADPPQAVVLDWLGGAAPLCRQGVGWGVPWPQGAVKPNQPFSLLSADGQQVPVQTWTLACWPDGSVKWTGHAISAGPDIQGPLKLSPGDSSAAKATVRAVQNANGIEIDTGAIQCRIPSSGSTFIESMKIAGREVARNARLVALLEDRSDYATAGVLREEKFASQIEKVTLEQSGPIRAVVKIEGVHRAEKSDRSWLPFTLRLYFYAGQEAVRLVHSFVFDGDDEKDFIRGLGLVFSVPMREQVHNRHVRFSGEGSGLWAEPLQPLTGRHALLYHGQNVYPDQLAGKRVPNREEYDPEGQSLIADWAVWDAYKLVQSTADGFTIQKRTNPQSCWLDAAAGRRASGLVFVGDVSGGLAVGVKNFWQSYPASLEVEKASTPEAELRLWLWSPDAPAMDLRHYDTKAHGLEASYEDVQPGFSTAHGVARTSELMLYPSTGVPSKEEMVKEAQASSQPSLLVCAPQYLHSVRAFGIWSLPDRSTPGKRWIEDQLDGAIAQYEKEIEQRHWYGFWNYGDIMHAYDTDRHMWRYDIGGYAWDNSELVPDMWWWYSFLRTGRADIFRMAEALTRHTGEVDVYHLGRFAGLGSRHNVRHWGDGAKEVRISQAPLRRFYYYLTTDERAGDLMREVVNADASMVGVDPLRVAEPVSGYPAGYPTRARIGPDWLALAGNWMTEWERTGDTRWRDKILVGVDCFSKMPYGLFTSRGVFFYDPKTGKLTSNGNDSPGGLNLTTLMGGPEMAFELTDVLGNPEWTRLWAQYCELYGAPGDEVQKAFGVDVWLGDLSPDFARLPAYAARMKKDPKLAQRAWSAFLGGGMVRPGRASMFTPGKVEGPEVLNPIDELPRLSTNRTSQWCLNAIELLELIGEQMPEHNPRWDGGAGGGVEQAEPARSGKVAAKPLFRDPVYDGAADPTVIWNRAEKEWFMFYTNRRANMTNAAGVSWVHGTKIGIAESSDGGATWTYRGTAGITYGGTNYTYWAPEVIDSSGGYHMFLSVVPGIFTNWNAPRDIVHLTSKDLLKWDYQSTLKLASDRVIDPCVLRLSDGTWRMWYNNERDRKSIYFADSPDLFTWQDKGKVADVSKRPGEGPKVFRWKDHYWMVVDIWNGLGVYRSDDALTWATQPDNLVDKPGKGADDGVKGGHPDVVVSGDRAFLFYFTHPGRTDPRGPANSYEQRRSSIQVVELEYMDGELTCDRDKPTHILLQPINDTK